MSKRIALIVGVNKYKNKRLENLRGAARDAKRLARFLSRELPKRERFEVVLLLNPRAEAVIDAFEQIQSLLSSEEDLCFVFYFAGHGIRYNNTTNQLLLCSDASTITIGGASDNGAIAPNVLRCYQERIGGRQFFCLDSCRASLDPRRRGGKDVPDEAYSGYRNVCWIGDEAPRRQGVCWTLSSCRDKELASDSGSFMRALIDTMRGAIESNKPIVLNDAFKSSVAERLRSLDFFSDQRLESGGTPFCLCSMIEEESAAALPASQDARSNGKKRLTIGVLGIAAAAALLFAGFWFITNSSGEPREIESLAEAKDQKQSELRVDETVGGELEALLKTNIVPEIEPEFQGTIVREERPQSLSLAVRTPTFGPTYGLRSDWRTIGELIREQLIVDDWGESAFRPAGKRKLLTVDGVDFYLRWCPAGSFLMGRPDGDSENGEDKLHEVRFSHGFWIMETEVTQKAWYALTGSNPSFFNCFAEGAEWVEGLSTENFPVERVSWREAENFAETMSKKFVRVLLRLPTEAEWEYASRAGAFFCYSGSDDLDEVGWYEDNSGDRTHEVGTKKPNGWGLYDMSGNVAEWCGDLYSNKTYLIGSSLDPKGPDVGPNHVRRGGSWANHEGNCLNWIRGSRSPKGKYQTLGFRLVLVEIDNKSR